MKKKIIGMILFGLVVTGIGYYAFIAIRNASLDTQIRKEIQNTSYAKYE